ncbi:MAG TPA: ABC transporter ATP-binding protein [Candidatus Limnocylindrales bacterium]
MTSATGGAATPAAIEVQGLRKRYGPVQAVDGIDFEVRGGEVFGLLGPNGAGKTTTVEILEGLRQPDGGRALVLGLDAARQPDGIKERIGVQLQTAALYPRLTVTEVIDLFGSFYRHRLATAHLIEAFDLGERRDARTMQLSGGQQQRLSVALALVNDPELVFLDEPTTGLDPQARRSLWELVRGLQRDGKTVLLTTHYMEEAETLCDRVAIMDHGRILEMGTVEELVSRRFQERAVRFDTIPDLDQEQLAALPGVRSAAPEEEHTVLYSADVPATLAGLLEAAASVGAEARDLSIRPATLEDVFLALTGHALRD